MHKKYSLGLVWLRRDLRLQDNPALATALAQCDQVQCAFVFDTDILDALPRRDRRVEFIRESLVEVDAGLRQAAGHEAAGLIALHGPATTEITALAQTLGVQAVFAAKDYEPQALQRDAAVQQALQAHGIAFVQMKDHVVFEERELLTQTGKPYGVFTPYLRAWTAKLGDLPLPVHSLPAQCQQLAARPAAYRADVPTLQALGFEATNLKSLAIPTGLSGAGQLLHDFVERMDRYDETRNYPAVKGPSYLGVHLRFGTVSIRSWDEGPDADELFAAWCIGATGYPLVDAAMAQLNQTGYMHNRLRMVAGSFMVKHLGLDWRRGERYFALHLNDFDLSANNGGWQWVSSSGCDAQPYFRIFNPMTQSEKFDAQGKFIRRYVPALKGLSDKSIHAPWLAKPLELQAAGITLGRDYPLPVVDHAKARARTLLRYGVVKK